MKHKKALDGFINNALASGTTEGVAVAELVRDALDDNEDFDMVDAMMNEVIAWANYFKNAIARQDK